MKHQTYKQLANVFIACHEDDFKQWLEDNSSVDVDNFIKRQKKRNIRYVSDLAIYLDISPIQLTKKAMKNCTK